MGIQPLSPTPAQPAPVPAQVRPGAPAAGRTLAAELEIAGGQQLTDTQLDLQAGDRVSITATGTVQFPGANPTGPDGMARGWKDLLRILPVNSAGRGALVGRIGAAEGSEGFLVGAQRDLQVAQGGRLFLGINQAMYEQPTGSFKVKIQIVPGRAETNASPLNDSALLEKMTSATLRQLPRRVSDPDGNPGDMINFLILGPEQSVGLALETAGWVKVDRTTKDAVLHGLLASISKQSYVEMPMSTLTLFNRPQDYGYAHADPLLVAMTRHHFRLWRAPFEVSGQSLWVGAGTHDVGLERDQRNHKLTHKIDPAVDGEREYIAQSLTSTGMLMASGYVTPPDPVTTASTATGGDFHSDGRILVMLLRPSGNDQAAAFAGLFCSVLQHENPDGGRWGDCAQYLKAAPAGSPPDLGTISRNYRVLVLSGFLSSCISSVQALEKGQAHLRDAHGLTVEYLGLPNASSEANGKLIADYVTSHMANDPRKYILVGYSKGAPDAQVALAQSPEAATGVAAFISLGGAIGGSPLADAMPSLVERYTKSLNLGSCQGDLAEGAKSLRSDVRHNFLALHPSPLVPSYSLTGASDNSNTSRMLEQAWQLLSVYGAEQDSQLTREDATVPGSTYLGSARADHLALALAFEDSSDAKVRALLDHNHYPRSALFEALVRWAVADLEKNPAR